MRADVIVVGAGLAGLGAAWKLQKAGLKVLVLEKKTAASGASGAAAGMLAPSAELKFGEEALLNLELESLRLWPSFVAELEAESGMSVDYRTHGTLIVAIDRDDFEKIDHQYAYHQELKLDVIRMSGDALREREPGLSPKIPGGLFVPGDHQVHPEKVVDALKVVIQKTGGTVLENHEVTSLEHNGERVTGVVLKDGRQAFADRVILSAGAWTKQLGNVPAGDLPRVRPVRGQMVGVSVGDPPILRHVLRAPDAYMVPRSYGELVIGSTMEEVGFDDRLTAGGVMDILVGAWEALPGIHEQTLTGTWASFRPMSLDNMPVIREGALDGLFWSTGHGRNGVLLTPITAQKLSALVLAG